MSARIICFEGIDGAGKTTQVKMLCDYLAQNNKSFFVIKGHIAFDGVKEKILELEKRISPISLFLLSMAKFKTISDNLSKYTEHYDYIILDRYVDTAIAYTKANIEPEHMDKLDVLIEVLKDLYVIPHLTVFINTNPEIALKRKKQLFDRIELGNNISEKHSSQSFLINQSNASYHYLNNISKSKINYVCVDGTQKDSIVHSEIVAFINNLVIWS